MAIADQIVHHLRAPDVLALQLDYLLVSSALFALRPEFDHVHVNTEFPNQASDHDPILARLLLYDRPD